MTLVTLSDPRSPVSEAYRTLRTNLSFYSLDEPIRTLVVAGPAPNEGTAVAAANLAVTMAQGGKRTILVECDLRHPNLHSYFGLPASPGFTESLLGEMALPLQETAVENLRLLTGGAHAPNPADLLGSRRVDTLIAQLAEQAEFVIFSAPPVVSVADATILGSKADGVLLVIEAGKTRRDHAQKAKEMLEKANVRIVGATLTNAPKDSALGTY